MFEWSVSMKIRNEKVQETAERKIQSYDFVEFFVTIIYGLEPHVNILLH